MNLTDRIKNGRMADGEGSGFRSNPADFGFSLDASDRGGTGADSNDVTNSNTHQPHSASGFKRALMRSGHQQNTVIDGMNKKGFSMKGAKKPNYFAQGGQRHGMHIGAGSPATIPAQQEGIDSE